MNVNTDLFRAIWEDLHAANLVDEYEGTEGQRVKLAWIQAGQPPGMAAFIIQEAHVPRIQTKPT